MNIVVLLLCVILSACVRTPVVQEPAPAPPAVMQELAPLIQMHDRFLAFRDNELFQRYGFTFNSPYADWLQKVREFEQNPAMSEAARLLAGLAVAARIHGAQSEVYRQFETRFDQALRGPEAREPAEHEAAEQKSAQPLPVEQALAEQESVAQDPAVQAAAAQGVEEQDIGEPLPIQVAVEQEPVAQETEVQIAAAQGVEEQDLAEPQPIQVAVEQVPAAQEPAVQVTAAQGVEEQDIAEPLPIQVAVEQVPVAQEPVAQAGAAQGAGGDEIAPSLPVKQAAVEPQSVKQTPAARRAAPPARSADVSILFSGDTQGVVFPQPGPFGSMGGLARRTSTIAHFRWEDPGVVLLDAGDAFASGFEGAPKINKALVRAMNQHRYDAMGLGNFDLAMGEVALRELAAMARFPMVCSNLEFQPGVAEWIKPYVILERNGRRIAVLSVMSASPGAVVTGARFVAPEKALGTLLPKLRTMADFVVLLTQLGSDEAAGLIGKHNMVDVILGDRSAASKVSPAYVPAVAKGLGLGLIRLHMPAPDAPARVEAMPVLLGADFDPQILRILDEMK